MLCVIWRKSTFCHGYYHGKGNRGCLSSQYQIQEYGEVKGRLYYDSVGGYLVVMNRNGAFAVRLSGEIAASMPEVITCDDANKRESTKKSIGWDFSPEHRVFYTWEDGIGITEKRFTNTV
jgi:hypothetical protein